MHSEIAIRIAAPPDLVFALAHDVERWADLLPHYARSAAVERRPDGSVVADFVARRPLIGILGLGLAGHLALEDLVGAGHAAPPLRPRRGRNEGDGRDLAHRAGGAGDPGGTGSTGCTVTIEHDFAPRLPGFAAFVDRFFTRPIAGRTLATFKALAEALQSGPALPTNPSP